MNRRHFIKSASITLLTGMTQTGLGNTNQSPTQMKYRRLGRTNMKIQNPTMVHEMNFLQIASSAVRTNSIFLDSEDGVLKQKGSDGSTSPLGGASGNPIIASPVETVSFKGTMLENFKDNVYPSARFVKGSGAGPEVYGQVMMDDNTSTNGTGWC